MTLYNKDGKTYFVPHTKSLKSNNSFDNEYNLGSLPQQLNLNNVNIKTKTDKYKETKIPKKKKEKIPAAVRKIVWNTYIGKDKNTSKCLCCSAEDISNTNFECGHIMSEKNGGEVNIENLRPICGHCNKSIGGNNMDEFMDRYKIKKPANWNGINSN